MTRREKILTLLDHLDDYHQVAGRTGQGDGDNYPALNDLGDHPSVKELLATIKRMLDYDPTARAHLIAYYHSEWRTTIKPKRIRDHKRRQHTVQQPVRERIINGWILPKAVQRGREHVIADFQGEPFLPDEFLTEITTTAA